MSVKVMSAVFERYPAGGGEMLLALALADHGDDDGGSIYPSVKQLAKKTRQSERTVQYQLRKMQENDWLELVAHEGGGRGRSREYRINPEWIKGANIAPFKEGEREGKGADVAPFEEEERAQELHPSEGKGCNSEQERVQLTTEKGATAIAPEPSGTVREPSDTAAAAHAREADPDPEQTNPPPGTEPPDPDERGRIPMWAGWQPSNQFPAIAQMAGVSAELSPDVLGEFRLWYLDPQRNYPRSQHDWERLLAKWLKTEATYGAQRSTQAGSGAGSERDEVRAAIADVDDKSWADGLG